MTQLILAFLKIFFRNRQAIFFVLVLPCIIYLGISFLDFENIIQFGGTERYTHYLLPGFMAFSLIQLGIFNAGYSLIDYGKAGVLKRLAVTPITGPKFLIAYGGARLGMAVLQSVLLLLFGVLFFGLDLTAKALLLLPVLMLGLVCFLSIGYLVAAFAKSYEDASPATAAINWLMVFLGDVFFPSGSLPDPLPTVAMVLPLKPLSELFRYALIDGSLPDAAGFLVLAVWVTVLPALSFWAFSKRAYR